MVSKRRRRPTFSGPQTAPSAGDTTWSTAQAHSGDDSGSEGHGSDSDSLLMDHRTHRNSSASLLPLDEQDHANDRRRSNRSRFGTSGTFVERWIRRSSASGLEAGNDFIGIPIDTLDRRAGQASNNMDTAVNSGSESLKSKPSTRRSSFDSSIDDVCMPLDTPLELETGQSHAGHKPWPDLQLLEDWSIEEQEEQRQTEAAELVNRSMKHPGDHRVAINETENDNGRLRLRPQGFPWGGTGGKSKSASLDPSLRFTYFRDDLPATIHSPTISGLLQPGQSFSELFPPDAADPVQPSGASSVLASSNPNVASIPSTTSGSAAFPVNMGPVATAAAAGSPPSTRPVTNVSWQSRVVTDHREPSPQRAEEAAASPAATMSSTAAQARADSAQPASVHAGTQGSEATQRSQSHGPSPQPTSVATDDAEVGTFWLDILNPTEEEMRVISKAFAVHPLTTEDILLRETREKVEIFHNYYFVCFTSIDVNALNKAAHRSGPEVDLDAVQEDAEHNGDSADATGNGSNGRPRRMSASGRSASTRGHRHRSEKLLPLAVYTIVFHTGVITIHYSPTPHTINVRRRIRLLRDYLNLNSDWISYALIDDITDGFGPLIDHIEEDVTGIEDAILRLHDSESDHSDDDDSNDNDKKSVRSARTSRSWLSSRSSGTSSTGYREWRRKGDMLRWIGETRKRVMALLGLLGNKADVIKGFSKRVTEQWSGAPRTDIALYLSDIQDHLVTMVQSLNHYEKLLSRSYSNYLAQLNIDMTRANNDMNEVLGRISVLGTIVLPMNIVTGLWGMNVLVPGQGIDDSLRWFWGIIVMMVVFSVSAYFVLMRYV